MRVQRTGESVVTGMPKSGDLKSEDTTINFALPSAKYQRPNHQSPVP